MKHIMIDIETMGTKPGAAIVQIGAASFYTTLNIVASSFYVGVTLASCQELGLQIDNHTLLWWMEQEDGARQGYVDSQQNGIHLEAALIQLIKYIDNERPEEIWVNGLSFDVPILNYAFEVCGLDSPWRYYQESDLRTLLKRCKGLQFEYPQPFVAHNAKDDAMKQAYQCMHALKYLGIQ